MSPCRGLVRGGREQVTAILDARFLLFLFDTVLLISLAAWIGAVFVVSYAVVPTIFRVLEPASAAKFLRTLYPRYYMWGIYSAAIALASLVCGRLTHNEFRGPLTGALALVAVAGILVMTYGFQNLTPAINAAMDAGPTAGERLRTLRQRSFVLNSVALGLGLVLLIGHAARPAPKSLGIIELSPEKRVQRDLEILERRKQRFDRELPRGALPPAPPSR
jgi:hypothetical protein